MARRKEQGGAIDIAVGAILAKLLIWTGAKTARGAKRLAFRWRRFLTPLVVGGLVWLLAVIWRGIGEDWWPLALLLPTGGGLLAWFGPKLNDGWSWLVTRIVPQGIDKGRTDVLDRLPERLYFAGFWTAVGGYLAIRVGWGASEVSGWWWTGAELLFGGFWWYHRRVRSAGRADRYAKKWSAKITDRDRCPDTLRPLAGSKVVTAHPMGNTALLRIRLTEGNTIDSVRRMMPALASFYRQRPNSVFVREDPNLANHVWIQFLPGDPWKGELVHPNPEVGASSLRSMGKKLVMGILADGTERSISLEYHWAIYGSTGGGKSVFIHNLMRHIVGATDAITVAIDMAGGATMNTWKRGLALPVATDLASAVVLLERVLAFVEVREAVLGNQDDDDDADSFEPTDETPWLFLVIDEFPDLIAAAKTAGMYDQAKQLTWSKYLQGLLDRIAKKARKTGTRLVVGSQNATKPDMGSKEFQAQLKGVISLNLDETQNKNLWGSLLRLGWTSTGLGTGQYLQRDPEHNLPERAKGWFVPKPDRRKAAAEAEKLTRMAEREAWAALMGMDVAEVVVSVPEQRGPKDRILRTLAVDGPMTVPELVEATGASRATVYRRLNAHENQLRKLDGGKYEWTGLTVEPVSEQAEQMN